MKLLLRTLALFAVLALPAIAAAQVQGEGPYRSPMKEQCNAELAKDAQWRGEIKNDLRAVVHTEEASLMLANKQHVVAAYAVLWGLVVVFVVLLFLRQRGLNAEIARLEDQLSKAMEG